MRNKKLPERDAPTAETDRQRMGGVPIISDTLPGASGAFPTSLLNPYKYNRKLI
ncbi:MAG: hypothetical protein PUB14_07310 [Lachnospiraceae bacterium]|nr:hypothetical protein [Lachnospiraceae bacterium]